MSKKSARRKELFNILAKVGGFIGGGVGDFGAKSGEMAGKGIKGLRTGKKQNLSFSTKDYLKSGARAGLTATAAATAGGSLVGKKAAAKVANSAFNRTASRAAGEKILRTSSKALQRADRAAKAADAVKKVGTSAYKIPAKTLRKFLTKTRFLQ